MAKFLNNEVAIIEKTNKIVITKYYAPANISPMDVNGNITIDECIMKVISAGILPPQGDREYVIVSDIPDELRKRLKSWVI